jgi:cellulose biosynthesis protein BcsQ
MVDDQLQFSNWRSPKVSKLNKILETNASVVKDGYLAPGGLRYNSYAISTLRGGVGKSTLAFNLAYEMSRTKSLMVSDVCPQCNLTETIMRKTENPAVTIYKGLEPRLLGPAFGEAPEDLSYRVSERLEDFKGGQRSFFIPGDAEMFAFPSLLYQQLQIAATRNAPENVKRLLHTLKELMRKEAKDKNCETWLIDTSPFYAGGTHLAWCAVDALIIPVRVDEHSLESLELTLRMLDDPKRDFVQWNERAGSLKSPRVAAIVMTMVGARSVKKSTPDRASQMYIERAIEIAERHSGLFDVRDPADAIVITDDFVSSGRISGAESIPIARLKIGKFHTVGGRRLQVNDSVTRYQRELAYLASII